MCSGCHREADPRWCEAPRKPECPDCHGGGPHDPILFAMERTISIRLAGAGADELAPTRERLRETLVLDDGFREVAAGAEFELSLMFAVEPVEDAALVPPSTGVRLFGGSCRAILARGGAVIVDETFASRVERTRDPWNARRRILASLAHRAVHAARSALEPLLED